MNDKALLHLRCKIQAWFWTESRPPKAGDGRNTLRNPNSMFYANLQILKKVINGIVTEQWPVCMNMI